MAQRALVTKRPCNFLAFAPDRPIESLSLGETFETARQGARAPFSSAALGAERDEMTS